MLFSSKITLGAISIFALLPGTGVAQSTEEHPSCKLDVLTTSEAFQERVGRYTWSPSSLASMKFDTRNSSLVYREFSNKTEHVYCDNYQNADTVIGGERFGYGFYTFDLPEFLFESFTLEYPLDGARFEWSLNGRAEYPGISYWYEPAIETSAGYIFDRGDGRLSCCYSTSTTPLRAVGRAPECTDTDADGWGWDGTQTCYPDQCDYTHAFAQNGWGWNESNGSSCAPTDTCIYDNSQPETGTGWNFFTGKACSASPTATEDNPLQDSGCDYRDAGSNNGWGWNPETMQSCTPRN